MKSLRLCYKAATRVLQNANSVRMQAKEQRMKGGYKVLNCKKTVAGLRIKKVWQKPICHTSYFIYVSLRLAYFALISLIKRSACPHLSII